MQDQKTRNSDQLTIARLGDSGMNEFLAFTLGKEEYGIDILKVQEIRGYESVTRIANAPKFIKGVVNLRGTIVPIVDMRIKFNLGYPGLRSIYRGHHSEHWWQGGRHGG